MTPSEPTPANSASEPRMGSTLRVGLVQLRSGREPAANLDAAAALIREAARDGAQYVQTPEVTNIMELDRKVLFEKLQDEGADATLASLRQLTRELGITLHIGSLALKVSDAKAVNRGFVIDPDGEISARYDKIHMFDVDLAGGESYRESATFRPGEEAVVAATPWGGLGMTICYDVRFPYLHRALAQAGARIITAPAAFTVPTGRAHWHLLLRARAVETGCFVLAPAQVGTHDEGRQTYGHSLIIAPWGEVLADAGGEETGFVVADLDLSKVDEARGMVPALKHDRPFRVVHAPAG